MYVVTSKYAGNFQTNSIGSIMSESVMWHPLTGIPTYTVGQLQIRIHVLFESEYVTVSFTQHTSWEYKECVDNFCKKKVHVQELVDFCRKKLMSIEFEREAYTFYHL